MARAQGARAQMALAYETVYGTPPVSGFRLMPFARATLGSEQPLLESELLGYGRDPLAPIKDAVTTDGEVVIPIDVEAFGFWLKAAFGQPTTAGTTPKTHTFQSGNWTLPSMSIETAMPEVPRFAMYSGCVLDQMSWQMQRSGLLTATARLVAQGETIAAATAAGTPTALGLQRFGHFNGTVKRNGTAVNADHRGQKLTLANVPPENMPVYDMLCRADAIGVFQVESRAQLNFLPRMRPREFYDLVCEVAIVRPGPIQGGMVHPFINRRQGKEAVEDLGPAMMEVLGRTYGVPLFQEQAMQIAVVAAGFTPSEADRLRRSLATFKRMGTIGSFRDRFVSGMLSRGYDADFAARCFAQIEGFGSYGFPESHAASFARLVYISAWLKCHHQAVFTCALLNSQPMGFYAPAQLVRDARDHGIEVRGVSVNHSVWDCTLEQRPDGALAIRLGFRQIKGMREEDAVWIGAARGNGYPDVESLWRRAGVHPDVLERLAEADAFAALGLTRRDALWAAKALKAPAPLPLFGPDGEGGNEPTVTLPQMTLGQEVIEDYLSLRLSLRAHPMELLRPRMPESLPHDRLAQAKGRITITGLVITRQRPGTAAGVIFLTLEDETGTANVIVWKQVYEAFRKAVIAGRLVRVTGRIQRDGPTTHIIAERVEDVSHLLTTLGRPVVIDANDGRADETRCRAGGSIRSSAQHPREQARKLFPSRDFH